MLGRVKEVGAPAWWSPWGRLALPALTYAVGGRRNGGANLCVIACLLFVRMGEAICL